MPPRKQAPNDSELVRRFLASRDDRAFRELYRAHTPAMLAAAWCYARGERTVVEDAVQEAWLRAAERLVTFRWESALRTWLVGIVINCARNRSRGPREPSFPALDEDGSNVPASFPDGAPRLDLERAVYQLPDGYREVLNLHDVLGYTHEEVAALLGIEAGTSKSQLSRARALLRRWLGEKGAEQDERRSAD